MYTDLSGFSFPIISAPWVISPFNSKALAKFDCNKKKNIIKKRIYFLFNCLNLSVASI